MAGGTDLDIVLVVAVAANGVIGRGSEIPWRLKTDQLRFRSITMARPIVMGRKTFESLPRRLPGRTSIVVTRDAAYEAQGAIVVTSSERALTVARGDALRRFATEIMVIGGAEIYREWMPLATRRETTEVHAEVAGDIVFRPDLTGFVEVARIYNTAGEGDSADFSYVTWRRRT